MTEGQEATEEVPSTQPLLPPDRPGSDAPSPRHRQSVSSPFEPTLRSESESATARSAPAAIRTHRDRPHRQVEEATSPTRIYVGDRSSDGRALGRVSSGIAVDISAAVNGRPRRVAFRGVMSIPELADAISKWRDQRPLLMLWFAVSVASVVLSMWWLEMGAVSGILGIIGSSISICSCVPDVSQAVSSTRVMSIAAMMMSALVSGVCVYIDAAIHCPPVTETAPHLCATYRCMLAFVAAWYALFSALSGLIAYQLTQIKYMLDPKTSGVLTLH